MGVQPQDCLGPVALISPGRLPSFPDVQYPAGSPCWYRLNNGEWEYETQV